MAKQIVTIQQIENAIAHEAFWLRWHALKGDTHPATVKQHEMQLDRLLVLYEKTSITDLGFTPDPSFRSFFDALGYPGSGPNEPDNPDNIEVRR